MSKKNKIGNPFIRIKNFFLSVQNIIGIDIGLGYIKIVQIQKILSNYELSDYRIDRIPLDIRDDLIKREQYINDFMVGFMSHLRVKTSLCRLAIRGKGTFPFYFLLPFIPRKDLRGAVSLEVKKRIPSPLTLKDVYFNYLITKMLGEDTSSRVTCIAIKNDILDKHISFLKKFNLLPVAINTKADALGNVVGKIEGDNFLAVLDMGIKESYLNFYKGHCLQFSREIPFGGEHLTKGIYSALSVLGSNITLEHAEMFKKQYGIPMKEEATVQFYTDFGAVKGYQITTALRPFLEKLVIEISRTASFHFRTYHIKSLEKLYITGGTSHTKNIDKFLTANLSNLSIKGVEKLNPLNAILKDNRESSQGIISEDVSSHLTVVLGLCLDKGGKINLVPPKERMEQKLFFMMFLTKFIVPLVIIAILAFYAAAYSKINVYKKINKQANIEIDSVSEKVKLIEEYYGIKGKLSDKGKILQNAVGRQPLWAGILKEISNITPIEAVLESLESESLNNQKKIIILGEVVSDSKEPSLIISQYTRELNRSPYFNNVDFTSSRDMYSEIPRATFEIVCEILY